MRHYFLSLTTFLVFLFGSVHSDADERYEGTDADIRAINVLRQQFAERISGGNIQSAMALMTDDAIYLQPGTDAISGNAAIRALWEGTTEAMIVTIDYQVTEIEVDQDMAYVVGDISFRAEPRNGGDRISDKGRYMWILRREDEKWKIARYMRHDMD